MLVGWCCHPELPTIMSRSADGSVPDLPYISHYPAPPPPRPQVRIWHANTYRQEYNFNYAYERCWSIAALKGTNNVALAYDEGARYSGSAPNQEFLFQGVLVLAALEGSQQRRARVRRGCAYYSGISIPGARPIGNHFPGAHQLGNLYFRSAPNL